MDSGLYQLIIQLRKSRTIQVGRLGRFLFPVGTYVYTGSAKAGLEARISRHMRKEKKLKWHIDYLLKHSEVLEVKRYLGGESECGLNQRVARLSGSKTIIRGFGSSDCRCTTHLFHFSRNPSREMETGRELRRASAFSTGTAPSAVKTGWNATKPG